MSEPGHVTRDSFQEQVGAHDGIVFIDVWGPRCQPCLALAPVFEGLAGRHGDRARFLKLRADANRMLCAQLRVLSLPTFLCFRKGEEVDRLTGEVQADRLEEWVDGWMTNGEL